MAERLSLVAESQWVFEKCIMDTEHKLAFKMNCNHLPLLYTLVGLFYLKGVGIFWLMMLNKQGPIGVWALNPKFYTQKYGNYRCMYPVEAKTGLFNQIKFMLTTFSQTMTIRVSIMTAGHLSRAQVFTDNDMNSSYF